ncbi:MAG TPA: thioredoxin family protein [Propionibacterium sp.]|jgi:small redox-active disulfide protein 2|nr:thioredoxin family protein [Propionibacterium sp.]
MQIKILGPGCANCTKLEKETAKAVAKLGIDATIEKVTDFGDIAAYGVMKTPGLVIDEEVVASGRVPTASKIAELLRGRA